MFKHKSTLGEYGGLYCLTRHGNRSWEAQSSRRKRYTVAKLRGVIRASAYPLMPRNRRNKVPFKHAKKQAEKQRDGAHRTRELRAKFQASSDAKKRLTPNNIHTHERQRTYPIETFEELLARPVPFVVRDDEDAYLFCDYCKHALRCMQIVIESLSTAGLKQQQEAVRNSKLRPGQRMAILSDQERTGLRSLRALWMEHLRTNLYTLWTPPPSSGGATARYSLAVQLWLLITHANVVLQRSNATDTLFDFVPAQSNYLLRNQLVVDTGAVMCMSMRALIMGVEKLVLELDTIDRFHPDLMTLAVAYEHRISELIAEVGSPDEFDAPEWCVSHGERAAAEEKAAKAGATFVDERRMRKEKQGGESTARNALKEGEEQCSDEFIMYSMVWLLTVYRYAECWCKLNVREMPDGRIQQTRVPAHIVARSQWVPSARSERSFAQLVLHYAKTLQDDVYGRSLRLFLLQFELRACDMDVVRLLNKHNQVHARTALEYEFRGRSAVARAYLRKVHYDRRVYEYVSEAFQWESGDELTTRSASMARQGFVRQLAVLFTIHQLIESKFRFPWKQRFLLVHRDAAFVQSFERARTLGYPFIVQQFSRFSVFVPHRRDPDADVAAVQRWRAMSRRLRARFGTDTERLNDFAANEGDDDLAHAMGRLALIGDEYNNANELRANDEPDVDPTYGASPHGPAQETADGILLDHETQQFNRVYDCTTAISAFAVWALWLLHINDGVIDSETSMRQFLLDAFGWIKPAGRR